MAQKKPHKHDHTKNCKHMLTKYFWKDSEILSKVVRGKCFIVVFILWIMDYGLWIMDFRKQSRRYVLRGKILTKKKKEMMISKFYCQENPTRSNKT